MPGSIVETTSAAPDQKYHEEAILRDQRCRVTGLQCRNSSHSEREKSEILSHCDAAHVIPLWAAGTEWTPGIQTSIKALALKF